MDRSLCTDVLPRKLTVELCDDDGADIDLVFEGLCLELCGLADGGVHDKDNVVRVDGLRNLQHLLEKPRLLLVPPARVHNDDLEFLRTKS